MTKPTVSLKKPTPASTIEAALSFAEAKQPSSGNERRVFFAPEGYRRLTINLSMDLHKRLKLAAIERDTTATKIIEDLLEKNL